MTLKLFIDECLSPELVAMAHAAGFEATCSRDRNLLGMPDRELVIYVVVNDFTLVTHNSKDFRGSGAPTPGGLHAKQAIHPGVICLNSEICMDLERQRSLFSYILDELVNYPDLINKALEIFEKADGELSIISYEIPLS